ncbi:MAG: hypothetical protein ABL872_14745 [Lacibacter sp.]
MYKTEIKYSFADYLPLFLVLCFSGNPIFTSTQYAKPLFILFAVSFILFVLSRISSKNLNKPIIRLLTIISCIVVLSVFQKYSLGTVSYPGVIALTLKITIGLFLMLYYQRKQISVFHLYINLLTVLTILSLPLFALNFFTYVGVYLPFNDSKTLFFYTSFNAPLDEIRNSGMFWEPGAFAGYLILALLFIILNNRKFVIGDFKKQATWLLIGLLTTMSTTGFLVLAIMIFIYVFQNYKYGRVIVLPIVFFISIYAYNNLEFLNVKIEEQYSSATEMETGDVSNTRFGSLNMDIQYIMDQPYTGNGLDNKTRYRFHPWLNEDIGHGNGMSNFLVYWGIPFFLLWVFCTFKFAFNYSESIGISIIFTIILLLALQGEQFLNYPIFLLFFTAPAIPLVRYEDKISLDLV